MRIPSPQCGGLAGEKPRSDLGSGAQRYESRNDLKCGSCGTDDSRQRHPSEARSSYPNKMPQMDTVTAGARVWVKTNGTVRHGVVSSVGATSGVLESDQPHVTIVLDDSAGVVATSLATRGEFWGVAGEEDGAR
jgi:hypothetical protein